MSSATLIFVVVWFGVAATNMRIPADIRIAGGGGDFCQMEVVGRADASIVCDPARVLKRV
jgi:hypothetical protein